MDKRLVMRWAALGSALLAAVALSACGDDDEGPIPQTGVRETTTTQAPPSTTAAPESSTTTAATSTTTTTTSTSTTTGPSA